MKQKYLFWIILFLYHEVFFFFTETPRREKDLLFHTSEKQIKINEFYPILPNI